MYDRNAQQDVLPVEFQQRLAISNDQLEIADICQLNNEFYDWLKSRFTLEDVSTLVNARSQYVDLLLHKLWCQQQLDEHQISLFAVGGYGRGELHPHSDVDILLLIPKGKDKALEEKIGAFITLLWDVKLDIGSSVRTIKDCIEQAKKDVTIATNLMEIRLICGNDSLADHLLDELNEHNLWPSEEFFKAKRKEQLERHAQYHGASYNLEPNLKANPGGLRDIQTIAWVAKKHFMADNMEQLAEHNYLTRNEFFELQECQDYLWRMRFALHFVAGRGENRLLFDYQTEVARMMGFGDEGKIPVESMMTRFYRVINRVSELNEILLQHFDKVILNSDEYKQITQISNEFQVLDGLIQVTNQRVLLRPEMCMQLFLMIADHPEIKGIHADTLRLLRNSRRRLISGLSDYAECRRLFIELIKHPRGLGLPFTLMHKYSIIGSYLKEWRNIVGQMQFDLFHAYSVDEHSYRLIKNLYRFSQPEHSEEFPLCSKIVQRLRKPEILFLAGIFHDIAKGRGGDHSELGAVDALRFSKRHKLNEHDGRLMAWLVKNHLVMSVTAQRKDISDPEVIKAFAEIVRDEMHLDTLYCLTVADMRATNESLWNSWKANLLEELYFSTRHALIAGLEKPVDVRDKIRENQQQAKEALIQRGFLESAIDKLWQNFKADYFLRYEPDQIQWHCRNILEHGSDSPLVLMSPTPYRGGTEVFVYTKERANIFAQTAAYLGAKRVSIHDAKIITSKDGHTLNTFVVLEQGQPIKSMERAMDIKNSLVTNLARESTAPIALQPISQRNKHFKVKTKVSFFDSGKNHTKMEIVSADRPGLLATLGQVFQHENIVIENAKITTFGERAEDFFTVSTQDGKALSAEQQAHIGCQIENALT